MQVRFKTAALGRAQGPPRQSKDWLLIYSALCSATSCIVALGQGSRLCSIARGQRRLGASPWVGGRSCRAYACAAGITRAISSWHRKSSSPEMPCDEAATGDGAIHRIARLIRHHRWGYIVLRASHPAVTGNAGLSKCRMVTQPVVIPSEWARQVAAALYAIGRAMASTSLLTRVRLNPVGRDEATTEREINSLFLQATSPALWAGAATSHLVEPYVR
jgi:hypothetical protein